MSPEQTRGQTLDRATDVWSLGCVLYEMLTGTATFGGDTVNDKMAAILRSDPDWGALPRGTPRSVKRLLARSLEKDPSRRLRDAGEARSVLEEATGEIGRGSARSAGVSETSSNSPVMRALEPPLDTSRAITRRNGKSLP